MLSEIPYSEICEAFRKCQGGSNFRKAKSTYGDLCTVLGLDNIVVHRKNLHEIIKFCNDLNQNEENEFTPPSQFENMPDNSILKATDSESLTACNNYNRYDSHSYYGQLTELLTVENTRHNRDYLFDFINNNSIVLLLRKTHSSILSSFEHCESSNTNPRHQGSIFGEALSSLHLPNINSLRLSLCEWRKVFKKENPIQRRETGICPTKNVRGRKRKPGCSISKTSKRFRAVSIRSGTIFAAIHEKSFDTHIAEFRKSTHQYPDKICDICNRLQYTLHSLETSKIAPSLLKYFDLQVTTRSVCKRCKDTINRKTMPAQALNNQMTVGDLPEELSCLSDAEFQLISQVRPFMKIFYLNKGRGQQAMKGTAIHFPNSLKEICRELPLLNTSSEYLLVHEKIEGLANHQNFRVRPTAIASALHWLKQNNWLYENINITPRDEQELQPITIEVTIDSTCVPAKNLPPQMLTYNTIGISKRILRASFSQGSDRFSENSRGSQCTAMSMVSIVYAAVQDPSTWTNNTMDEILIRGDQLYRSKRRGAAAQYLLAVEAQGRIDEIFGAITVTTTVQDDLNPSFNGQLNRLANIMRAAGNILDVHSLVEGITSFISSEYNNCILTVVEYSMALIKTGNQVYMFDSHSRGPKGRVASNGMACMIEFAKENASTEISQLIHRNLEPKYPPKSNNEMELARYMFCISPVLTDRDEPINQVPRSEHQATPEDEQEAEDIVDQMSNLLQQRNAFGGNVLIDSMFHNIDHPVPELKDVISTGIPSINLMKERGRPLYSNHEKFLEELSFVKMFPHGRGGLSSIRPFPITPLDYYQARVMSKDTRFWDNSYLFYGLNKVEEHHVKQKIAVCGQMQTNAGNANGGCEFPGLTNVHLYMSSIRGGASYWKNYTGDLVAMNSQLGIPNIFLTVSSDDLNSTDSLCGLLFADSLRGNGDTQIIKELEQAIKIMNLAKIEDLLKTLTYEQKTDLLNRHPVQAARHFDHRTNSLMKLLRNCGREIFGYPVEDYSYRIEFQNRGSAHIHMILWLPEAPTDYRSREGLQFIESNMCCNIPEDDEELKTLVLKYQQHDHKPTCFTRNQNCRFDFPRKVSTETVVLEEDEINRNKGRFCILKRNEKETFINNYHPILLKILKCNMDLQLITDANAIAYYIAKYISKAEPTDVQEEIQKIMKEIQLNSKASYHQMAMKIAMKILNKRQVGAPEAAYRLCHLKLRHSSRSFVFIPSFLPSQRLHLIQKESIGRENVSIGLGIIDKYCLKPASLIGICLLEFAALYAPVKPGDEDDDEELTEEKIRLNNGTIMKRRKRPAIIKYPNFDPIAQMEEYYYSMMLLYFPFLTEEDIIDGFPSIVDAFKVRSTQFRNSIHADFFRPNLAQEIDRALIRIQNFDDPLIPLVEGDDYIPHEIDLEDQVEDQGELFQRVNDVGDMRVRYHSLSEEQKEVFRRVRDRLGGNDPNPVLAFVSGAGGTGKSYLIDTMSSLISSYELPGQNILLRAAPTGMSALNINATTVHRAFKLPVQRGYIAPYTPLKSKQVEELRTSLKNVKWIIIDEISMVSYQNLRSIHLRLAEITNNDNPFGGLNVMVLGDLMQFRPINASWIFSQPQRYIHEVHLWKLFDFYELQTNHRQTGDTRYLELLNRLRFGECTMEDLQLLESRIFETDDADDSDLHAKFSNALALFPTRKSIAEFNAKKTEALKEQLAKVGKRTYTIEAQDTFATGSHFDEVCPENLVPKDDKLTAGIPKKLEVGVGSRIMLIRNWSLRDGLVNGSVGTVKGIKWTALRDEPLQPGDLPDSLIVLFDGDMGGSKKDINGYVRVQVTSVEFPATRKNYSIRRRAFPIVLCWAIVFHKCQGLTLCYASIDLSKSQFAKAMSYVVLSRLKSSGGLQLLKGISKRNILTLKKSEAPCDDDAVKELYRLRFRKIGVSENEISELVEWITAYPVCNCCKKWICHCKCK